MRVVLSGGLRGDTARWYERAIRLDLLERRERGSLLVLDEGYLQLRASELELRAGKIVYAWGSADGFNPTDNLNPRDYTDPLRAEKMGAVSTHLGWQRGDLGVDLVILPAFQPSRLPSPESRFTPDLPATAPNPFFPGAGPAELTLDYDLEERELPSVGFRNLQEAVRFTWKLPGSQLNATYQHLVSDLPAFEVQLGLPDLSAGRLPVRVVQRFYRQELWGLDFQTAVGEYGLRGEVARSTARDPLAQDYVVAVVGADRRFADLVGEQDLTLIASLLARRVTGSAAPGVGGLLDVELPFEEGVLLHALWEASTDVTFDVSLFTAFREGDYQEALLSWRIADPLKLEVKVERAAGPADAYLGTIEEQSRLWARLRYSF